MDSGTAYSANRVEALRRMFSDSCKHIDDGKTEAAFEGLLHTASAAVDRLQLIGPECIGAKGTAPFDMATSYLHIIKQAVDKFGELLEGKVPVTPGSLLFDSATTSEEMDAAFKEVVDAINAASGPFSSIKGPEADADDPNSPTTATQIMLPKFELIVSEGEAVQRMGNETVAAGEVKEETERGEAAAEVSRETKPEATSDAPAIPESTLGSDMGALEIQPAELELQAPKRGTSLGTIKALASKGSKNHLEVDTEAGKKKLDKRTSKEKLEDAVAGALEQLSEARSPADDWVLAGSPSASRRSLVSSRQASSSSIIRKPKLLPQVSDLMQEPPLEEIVDGLATSEAESANETSCVVKDGASIEVVDDGGLVETAKASEMEAEVEFEAGDDEEATPTCPTHVAAEPLPGPWSDATTIRGSIASLIPETIPEDSPIVIPARGQSLRNPISQASAASEREPPPPRRSDSLRLSHSPSHSHLATSQSMTFRRSTSVGRSPSQGSFALTPAHHAETLPTNIIEAQNVNSTIWKEYLNITAEFKDRNEPVPVELAMSVMHSMIQNYAAAREHWERSKSHRNVGQESNLPPLPRKMSTRISPSTNFKSPGADSAVTDLSPRSVESATTVVSGRSPAYELTPGADDGTREEQRLKRLAGCQMIVREIYETEVGFKDSLRVLTEAFGQQMRAASAMKDPMITRRDVEVIFKHTPDLVAFSNTLCQEFKVAAERYQQDPTLVGNVFANHAGDFEIFIHFVTNYSRAKATIRRYEDISPAFKKFLQERHDSPDCKKQDIHSYLIMPIQRAMRYYLLLTTLVKKMDPNTEACQLIESACLLMNEISQAMNRMQQQEEEINGLFDMHRLVEFCPDTILSSSRRFEKAFMCEDVKKQRHVRIFVLSDLVIFSRLKKDTKEDFDVNVSSARDKEAIAKGKKRYTLKEMCFVIDVRLLEPQDGDDGTLLRMHLVNPFRVGNDGKPKASARRVSMRSKRRTMSSNSQSRSRWPFGGKSAGHESSDEEIEVSDTSSRQSSPQRSAEMADSGRDMRTMRSIRSRADNRASMLVDNRASMVIDDASSIVFFDDDDRGIVEMQFKFPDTMARDDMVRLISDLQAETFRNDDGDFY